MLAIYLEGKPDFEVMLAKLEMRGEADFAAVESTVREILAAVRTEGDAAVQRYNERFGRRAPRLIVRDYPGAEALARLPAEARAARDIRRASSCRLSPRASPESARSSWPPP